MSTSRDLPPSTRFTPGWKVRTVGGSTVSTCRCGWEHIGPDRNLATIARVAHELDHRRRAGGTAAVADFLTPGDNVVTDVLERVVAETGVTRERAMAAVTEAVLSRTVVLTPRWTLRRA